MKKIIISILIIGIFLLPSFLTTSGAKNTILYKIEKQKLDYVIDIDTTVDAEDFFSFTTPATPDFLKLKWTFDPLGDHTTGSITLEDIDEDGYLEILFSSGFNEWEQTPGWTYVLRHDGIVQQGWPKQTDSEPEITPAAADIDLTYPGLEVITTSNVPWAWGDEAWSGTYAWHYDGTTVDGWPIGQEATYGSPSVEDIDGDNLLEVVYPTDWSDNNEFYGIHVRNGNGSETDGWPVFIDKPEYSSNIAVADIDNNGDIEIVIGHNRSLYAFHHDGSLMQGWPKYLHEVQWGKAPVLADIDGDGDIEIFMASDGYVYAFHHTGESVDGWPVTVDYRSTSLALGDINNDDEVDIVAQSSNYVYAWNTYGELHPGWPVSGCFCCIHMRPILGDIDGDGTIEIVLPEWNGLDAFHHDGKRVEGFPITYPNTDRFTSGAPALGDIDVDGKLELVAVIEGDVMVWDCEGSKTEWPMFQYDAHHTGIYKKFDGCPSAPLITGTLNGKPGTSYEYTFNAVDPDGDQVKYVINWGDGNVETTALNPSGEDVKISHIWFEKGTYIIKAKAKDSHGAEGPWGELEVTMPKNKMLQHSLLQRLLERFPNAFPILRYLLGL